MNSGTRLKDGQYQLKIPWSSNLGPTVSFFNAESKDNLDGDEETSIAKAMEINIGETQMRREG